jgi:GNAT superfamily N-acetyltransferase
MHFHPLVDESSLHRIGVWEDEGEMVALVHHEHRMGEVYFEVAPAYADLKPTMLDHALEQLAGADDDGRYLAAYVDDRDENFQTAARERAFSRVEKGAEPMTELLADAVPPNAELPPGFRITDLEQDDDIMKVHRLMHRGFDHPGEPDPADLPGRRRMQSAPNFRRDLAVAVAAPDESFASCCWMWYEPVNRFGYVEPVCTDPDHRRLGLGRAAVIEGVRRCVGLGATRAYVGSTLPIYRSIGFRQVYLQHRWVKRL